MKKGYIASPESYLVTSRSPGNQLTNPFHKLENLSCDRHSHLQWEFLCLTFLSVSLLVRGADYIIESQIVGW